MNFLFVELTALLVPGLPLAVAGYCLLAGRRAPRRQARVSTAAAATSLGLALVLLGEVLFNGDVLFGSMVGLYVDRLSAVMVLLIAGVGTGVHLYSRRYFDGDARQGVLFGWLSLVSAAALSFAMSRNLVQLWVSWLVVSAALHSLLTYYRERAGAQHGAWQKYVVSRIGDLAIVAALTLIYLSWGTFDIPELLRIARSPVGDSATAHAIAVLLVVGAMTKSAQFPFHTWLPQTLDAPTPVSALMHAGIINAGGFLVVRLHPLVGHSVVAQSLLVGIGTLTALLGIACLSVQTDIKRTLAYSTVAQMGFMMLQCGLGAYAAAVLHLFLHGIYKAHAFLASGTAVARPREKARYSFPAQTVTAALAALAIIAFSANATGTDLRSGANLLVAGFYLWIAYRVMRVSCESLPVGIALPVGGLGAFAMSSIFFELKHGATALLQPVLVAPAYPLDVAVPFVLGAFMLTAALDLSWQSLQRTSLGRRFYVTALNRFSVDEWRRRILRRESVPATVPSRVDLRQAYVN